MTLLEGTVVLLLLLLSLPGLCRRYHRPGLLYPGYIVAGALAGAFMSEAATGVWREVGQLGFILLLFSVGLEVEIPERRASFVALRRSLLWILPQVLALGGLFWFLGCGVVASLTAAVALASTSVGMAYVLWKHQRFATPTHGKAFLEWLVAIEVITILFLATAGPILEGLVWWMAILRFLGLVVAAVMAAFIALRLLPRLGKAVSRGLSIETPLLVLVLFAICAVGARLGLSAPKTAFVLGLFISRSTDEEVELNHRLEPLRDRMFVPVFFFGLGTLLRPDTVLTLSFAAALAGGCLLYFLRRLYYRLVFARVFRTQADASRLAAPMLTLGAVAVEVLNHSHASPQLVAWTLGASLSLTICAVVGATRQKAGEFEPALAAPEALEEIEVSDEGPESRA